LSFPSTARVRPHLLGFFPPKFFFSAFFTRSWLGGTGLSLFNFFLPLLLDHTGQSSNFDSPPFSPATVRFWALPMFANGAFAVLQFIFPLLPQVFFQGQLIRTIFGL